MTPAASKTPPRLECRALPAFTVDSLADIRATFAHADGCVLGQAWRSALEPDFTPGTVRVGWRGDALLILAELVDADIFTHATALNQRMWELGDTFEIFLQPATSPGYAEFHVTPNNQRLQIAFAHVADYERVQASGRFEEVFVPGELFHSQTWCQPERQTWWVYAEIPAASVGGTTGPLPGTDWRFSFSRYDCIRGRPEPILSSSSPHAVAGFHRRQEWGALHFVPAAKP